MILSVLLLCLQLSVVTPDVHRKPVAKTLWHERCSKNDRALNDCNWCRCDVNHHFSCTARVCSAVDMFGHFNDAIKAIDVGMEGHGVWRSSDLACQPGVRYQRDSLLCMCSDNGSWPNPVCRDVFRVLHPVEIPEDKSDQCIPTKLYLIGCNVCYCPSTGRIDPEFCTKKPCAENDPVLKSRDSEVENATTEIQDLYAECAPESQYQLGCRTCICLRNNRLLCGNCTRPEQKKSETYCETVAPLKIFNVDCNLCYCEEKGKMICSSKKCLENTDKALRRRLMDIDDRYLQLVDAPLDDHYCTAGTKYKRGCNLCICLENEQGVKMFACTLRNCDNGSTAALVTRDCVLYSSYELNCRKCSCVSANEEKWEWCEARSRCSTDVQRLKFDLESLHGYCEPLHEYMKDCNKCHCLSDGQTLACTDLICRKSPKPITIEIIPVQQRGTCPNGHSYKINCNICMCLSNGNALCTTLDCKKDL